MTRALRIPQDTERTPGGFGPGRLFLPVAGTRSAKASAIFHVVFAGNGDFQIPFWAWHSGDLKVVVPVGADEESSFVGAPSRRIYFGGAGVSGFSTGATERISDAR